MKSSVSYDITPYSPFKVNRRFREIYCLHLQGQRIIQARNQHEAGKSACYLFHADFFLATCIMLFSCLAYSSTQKMEATCATETSGDIQRTVRRYIQEDRTLQMITSWQKRRPKVVSK
jgi:hypothetical protein